MRSASGTVARKTAWHRAVASRTRLLAGLVTVLLVDPARAAEPFSVFELPGPGRVVTADIADLDGDGRSDIWALSIYGVPPDSRRELRIHFQRQDGSFADTPDWTGSAVDSAAAYDIADLPDGPGEELLLLRRDRVSVLSFAGRKLATRDLVIPGDPTIAAAPDERGLDRYRLMREEVGPNLLVPGLGELIVLTPAGEVLSRPEVGARANYFIPHRPGPLVGESEIESYFDFAHIEIGDANGDGRGDLIASTRHELRVFQQREGGGFPQEADQTLAFRRLDETDQIRGSGNVRMTTGDFDGDGRADLLVTSTTGGLLNARSETSFHLNREGTWNLAQPDGSFVVEGGWSSLQLIDLDGDGRPELAEARVALTILEIVE
ncbi:MAG: FG-GAP repeat domain-containing protein, partial [Myxococcota bacterium]